MPLSTAKRSFRNASHDIDNAQRNETHGRRCGKGQGARGRIRRIEWDPKRDTGPSGVGKGQPSLKRTTSQPSLKIADKQDAALKEGLEVQGMYISQNHEDERRELFPQSSLHSSSEARAEELLLASKLNDPELEIEELILIILQKEVALMAMTEAIRRLEER